MSTAFYEVVESMQSLNLEQKQQLRDLTEKVIIDERREEILNSANEARKLHKQGKLKGYDNVSDLMKSLNED